MNIIDIIIAKKKSFTEETEKLTRQAQEAMSKANEVAAKIDDAQDALDAAEAANTRAQEVAEQFDGIVADFDTAANDIIDNKLAAANIVTNVNVEDNNSSSMKSKQIRVQKNGIEHTYITSKNYTSTGQSEDGGMTQKAITSALNTLDNRIKNINISGGGGSGNISGELSAEDAGSIVVVNENGNISPSAIKEEDLIKMHIITGTYENKEVIGLEIDYANKAFSRLQGAINLSAGSDFNKFDMYGGRKRCIVNKNGNIIKFIDENTNRNELEGQRIMVYQPAFYYMRVPFSTTLIGNNQKINKEHLYLSDNPCAGFKLHPAFYDENNNPVKFILLPAFESAALRASNDELVTNDAQNVDLEHDSLISTIDIKPISGYTQAFTYFAAQQMCQNNGTGWAMTDLAFESVNQMLMIVEYGTLNIQNALNKGIVDINNTTTNNACITGSTFELYNASGRASSTINNISGTNSISTIDGRCAISYRGLENPYGNTWRFVNNFKVTNNTIALNNNEYPSFLPTTSGWINGFGFDESLDWAFLPIELGGTANSNLPIGDYCYGSNDSYLIIGGSYAASTNAGPFYYNYNNNSNATAYYNDSARIMFTPTANSSIESNNYNTWINT